jgi:hypothetical protein
MFLLAKHIRRSWLRARAGSQELGVPLAEYAASLRFQTSAPLTPKGRARTSFDIPEEDRADPRSGLIKNRWWSLSGSNRRPEACKATALPAELRPHSEWASDAGGNVRSLGLSAPWGAAAGRPSQEEGRRLRLQRYGGPGTTRTSDLTLIRGAL